MKPTVKAGVIKVSGGSFEQEVIDLPVEALYTLYLNDNEILTFMATPKMIKELAVGFLATSGVIEKGDDINSIIVNDADGVVWVETGSETNIKEKLLSKRFLTSGCAGGEIFEDPMSAFDLVPLKSTLRIDANIAFALMGTLLKEAKLYKISGGMHGVMLAKDRKKVYLAEDIGRHNAVDKVIGAALLNGESLDDMVLVATGRISSEMLIKAARSGIAILISRTAATELAVGIAEKVGATIAGYLRKDSMYIYSNHSRIKL